MKMASISILASFLLIFLNIWETHAYGRLMNPVNRGSAWRLGFQTPINYNDMANNCGGLVKYIINGEKCGVCGDDLSDVKPRDNENGGKYGKGVIVRTYTKGESINLEVELTANLNGGTFEFSICNPESNDEENEEKCYKNLPVAEVSSNFQEKYILPNSQTVGLIKLIGNLPEEVTCNRCVLRWEYVAANNWGICDDGTGKLGCGPQEHFRTCSDIEIRE